MSEQTEYCCVWCHKALAKKDTYVETRGTTTCKSCRGLGIVLDLWNKPCKRRHSVDSTPAPTRAEGESECEKLT